MSKMDKKFMDEVVEVLFLKLLDDTEKNVEEITHNQDGSYYSRTKTIRVLSHIVQQVVSQISKRLKDEYEKFKVEQNQELKKSIGEYMSKDKIKENIEKFYNSIIDEKLVRNSLESLTTKIDEVIRERYSTIRKDSVKSLADRLVTDHARESANKYIEKNKKSILASVDSAIEYKITIQPIVSPITINSK